MLRELLETEHELVHARYRISHENRGTIGQTVYVFSDFILLDSDLCVCVILVCCLFRPILICVRSAMLGVSGTSATILDSRSYDGR